MTGTEIAELEKIHGIYRGQKFFLTENSVLEESVRCRHEYEVVMLYPHIVQVQKVRQPHTVKCFDYWQMNIILGRGNRDVKEELKRKEESLQ